jgi:protein-S-isoprenylcysteine O-methyltransferase Ste14
MIEIILLVLLTTLYLFMFIARNIAVKKRIDKPVRKADWLVSSVIVLTTFCFIVTLISTSDKIYPFMGKIDYLRCSIASYLGLLLLLISIILCWIFSSHLKDSWRVGVHEDQKTVLIKDGIYVYVRNPYFVSYFVMYLSLILIRPSLVLLALVIFNVIIFHRMVLKEEAYLLKTHGKEYEKYKAETGRYLPCFR